MLFTVGMRLQSAADGDDTQVLVIRSPQTELDVTCGGHPLVPLDVEPPSQLSMTPKHDGGTLLGKRYVDPDLTLELLCTKAGAGALFLGATPLSVRAAKALPASD